MVKMRLARAGAKRNPFYKVVVTDSRNPRDGRFIEQIGHYDPKAEGLVLEIKQDRLEYWKSKGAQTSETLGQLLKKQALLQPEAAS
jgi:small subunit ribosomal protein S16